MEQVCSEVQSVHGQEVADTHIRVGEVLLKLEKNISCNDGGQALEQVPGMVVGSSSLEIQGLDGPMLQLPERLILVELENPSCPFPPTIFSMVFLCYPHTS